MPRRNNCICMLDRAFLSVVVATACVVLNSCGTSDYKKPTQQFQDASAVVITAAGEMLNHVNVVEQNAEIDQAVFEQRPIDINEIRKLQIVAPKEIDIRIRALDRLNSYVTDLASLASGKPISNISTQTEDLSQALSTLAQDASVLPISKSSFIKNAQFGNALQSASNTFGNLAKLLAQHRARSELEKSIGQTRQTIDSLLALLKQELQGAYERQQSTLGKQEIYFTNMYKDEQRSAHPDPVKLLLLGDRIKTNLHQEATLAAADPGPSLTAMRDAHDALINYAESNHDSDAVKKMLDATQTFSERAKAFGDAVQTFFNAKQ